RWPSRSRSRTARWGRCRSGACADRIRPTDRMRRFVSDFLLPVVRGGAAHVGRPLGMDLVARMLRELPVLEGPALEKLAACRAASAMRVSPVVSPPPFDETSLRLAAALHDLLA